MENGEISVVEIKRSTFRQCVLGLISYFATIAPSMTIGYSAVALPILLNPTNPNKLSSAEASWFASIAPIATPLGSLIAGPIADRFGRKTTFLCINITTFIGWILIAIAFDLTSATQYAVLLVGRLFTGFSTGLASMPAGIYMSEVSSPKLRGVFATANGIFFGLGIFFVYLLGYLLKEDIQTIAIISAVLPLISMLMAFIYLPESPSWLIGKNNIAKASQNICRIYGIKTYNELVYNEVQTLVRHRDAVKVTNIPQQKHSIASALHEFWRNLKHPTCYKPLLIILTFFFFQQFSGTFVIIFYAINVVEEANISIDPYVAILLIAGTRVVASLFVSFVSKDFGRRPSSIISGIGMTLCMISLSVYLYLKTFNIVDVSALTQLPVVCLMAYFLTSTLGFLVMPFALAAECFPLRARGILAGLSSCFAYTFNFIIVKLFPTIMDVYPAYGVFMFFGVIAIIGTIFVWFFLPETKGKSLEEIEAYFAQDNIIYVASNPNNNIIK